MFYNNLIVVSIKYSHIEYTIILYILYLYLDFLISYCIFA